MSTLNHSDSIGRTPVYQQEQLLEAVAFSARELLSNKDWHVSINEILMKLGQASGSSRAYVFRHEAGDPAGRYTSLAFEWCAPGIAPQISIPELQNLEVEAVGFQRWIELMGAGRSVFGAVEDFPKQERPLLEQQDIKSLLVIPFFVAQRWWGFIGFDQCDQKRDWSPAERGALQAAASMIGSAIERQNAEQLLQRQFAELQKANHELDSFVYSVSHDLRAPLASILGLVNVAQLDDQSSNRGVYLQHIRASITRLDGFIQEILEYSRNTRLDVELHLVDLRALLGEVREQAQLTGDKVRFEFSIQGERSISIDRRRVLVIFNNLITNAYKFKDIGKNQNWIRVKVDIQANELVVQVEDNGIGIESAHLPRVFDMFYRATDRSPGSGLGLYIARESVLKLRGTIGIKSVFGQGTQVEVRLPVPAAHD